MIVCIKEVGYPDSKIKEVDYPDSKIKEVFLSTLKLLNIVSFLHNF
jgi:hypothetical protein